MLKLSNKNILNLKYFFLDALFPIRCIGCGAFDDWICKDCHIALPLITQQHCPVCNINHAQYGELCPTCYSNKEFYFDGVFVSSQYNEPIIKKAIHHYKYRFVRDLATPLAMLIAQSLQHSSMPSPDLIIPVPLHKRRLRWRGYNQSELLAQKLNLDIPIASNVLIRTKYTTPQVKMKNKKQRIYNMQNAFKILNEDIIQNKDIILVDDVMTTGSTLNECAKTLKQNGARSVFCIVIARE